MGATSIAAAHIYQSHLKAENLKRQTLDNKYHAQMNKKLNSRYQKVVESARVKGRGNASDVFAFQKYKQSILKGDILSNSRPIISGVDLNDTRAINALTKNGDDIADWVKMSSNAYDTPYGRGEFHFYKNQVTGEISSYNSKLKIPKPKNLWSDKTIQEYYIIDVDSNFEYLGLRN